MLFRQSEAEEEEEEEEKEEEEEEEEEEGKNIVKSVRSVGQNGMGAKTFKPGPGRPRKRPRTDTSNSHTSRTSNGVDVGSEDLSATDGQDGEQSHLAEETDIAPKEETDGEGETVPLNEKREVIRVAKKKKRRKLPPLEKRTPFNCDLCDYVSYTKRSMTLHKEVKHEGRPAFACDQCDSQFTYHDSWKLHRKTKHGEGASEAHQLFLDKRKARRWLGREPRVRAPRKPILPLEEREQLFCDLCNHTTFNKRSLRNHKTNKHERPLVENTPVLLEDGTVVVPSQLPREKKRTRGKSRNPRGRAPRKKPPPLEQRTPFVCDICSHTTYTKRSMNNHKAVKHEGRRDFLCDQCDKTFAYADDVRRHRLAMHENVIFTCETCGFQTSHESSLRIHVSRIHQGKRTAMCDQCDYKSWSRSELAKHVRGVHDKIKAYACDLCPFPTANQSSIARHRSSVHFKQARYQCPHCDCAMVLRYNLKKHIESVHKLVVVLTGLKPVEREETMMMVSSSPAGSVKNEAASPKAS